MAAATPQSGAFSRSASESERYEICELRPGKAPVRVLAAAGTRTAARLALRTLYEDGEAKRGGLVILDAATGRRLPG